MKTIKPKKIDDNLIYDLLEQAAVDGVIICPVCGNHLEPDAEKCGECGWKNVLVTGGYV